MPTSISQADGRVQRSRTLVLDLPPLGRISNREDLIFEAADPILEAELATRPGSTPGPRKPR